MERTTNKEETESPQTSSLAKFVLLAYALTWVLLAPFFYLLNVRYGGEMQSWMWTIVPLALLGGWGPSLAGIIVAARTGGRREVKKLFGKLLQWRASVLWYLLILTFPPALTILSVLVVNRGFGAFRQLDAGSALTAIPFAYLLALPFGPLGEEFGWRGFALPKLLTRYGAVRASLILGVIWTFWHIPMMLWSPGAAIPTVMGLTVFSVAVFLIQITSETVLMTLAFLRTNGSLLLAVIFHTSLNTAEAVVFGGLPEPTAPYQRAVYLVNVALLSAAAAAALLYFAISHRKNSVE